MWRCTSALLPTTTEFRDPMDFAEATEGPPPVASFRSEGFPPAQTTVVVVQVVVV